MKKKKAKEKEAADKAPAGKGKKDAKKGKKKWCFTLYNSQLTKSIKKYSSILSLLRWWYKVFIETDIVYITNSHELSK